MDDKILKHGNEIISKKRELTLELIKKCKALNDEDCENDDVINDIQWLIESTGKYLHNLRIGLRVLHIHEKDHKFVDNLEYL